MKKKKITNLTIIANYIDKNPGCRRIDVQRHLHEAKFGTFSKKPGCNQYFQRYGQHNNVYLDRLWYNKIGKHVTKSEYYLTRAGESYVNHDIQRNFHQGQYVSVRNEDGGPLCSGLVIECTDSGGVWIYTDGRNKFFNFRKTIVPIHG